MNVLPNYEHRLRLDLYEQGMLDREIAEYMGVSRRAITYWRESNKLKPNGRPGRKKEEERVRSMYKFDDDDYDDCNEEIVKNYVSDEESIEAANEVFVGGKGDWWKW